MNAQKGALWRRILLKDDRLRGTIRLLLYFPTLVVCGLALMIPPLLAAPVFVSLGVPSRLAYAPGLVGEVAGVLLATWLCRRFLDRRSFVSLGFRFDRLALGDMTWGVLMGAVLFAGVFAVEVAAGWLTVSPFRWEMAVSVIATSLVLSVVQYIGVGIVEETVFRGYLLQALRDDWGTVVAVIASSVLFGLGHAGNDNATPLALFNLFVIGALFAYGYLVTRQLWLPIALHFSWNFFQGPVFGLPVSGSGRGDLWATQVSGPDWVTGGAFGPEGGVLVLAGIAALWGLTWAWGRLRRRWVEPGMNTW